MGETLNDPTDPSSEESLNDYESEDDIINKKKKQEEEDAAAAKKENQSKIRHHYSNLHKKTSSFLYELGLKSVFTR